MARQTALPVPLQIIAGFGALIGVAAGEVPIGLDGGSRGEREGGREGAGVAEEGGKIVSSGARSYRAHAPSRGITVHLTTTGDATNVP